MNKNLVVIANRMTRLFGNIFKILAYPIHFFFPKLRFTIPVYSKAKITDSRSPIIPRIIWQTNYSNKVTFPVYANYLFNRLMSLSFDYRYVSTEEREVYIQQNTSVKNYQAFMKLRDGAAQADFWRMVVLNKEGGIYMDIDATLFWPLKKTLDNADDALYVSLAKNNDFTNFFLATAPNNPVYEDVIERIVSNIDARKTDDGVYFLTGPGVLTKALEGKYITSLDRKYVCIQGAFTNEHFQYLDKPRGKWTHKKPEDLLH